MLFSHSTRPAPPMDTPPLMESAPGPEVMIDGRRYRYFGGTSYLGLHGHPAVIEAGCEGFRQYGFHTATSRTGFGNSPPLLEVERRAAAFAGREAAFYFSSGYAANHILIQGAAGAAVFVDETAHFCVMEASRLPGVPVHLFRSRDPGDLRARLAEHLPPLGRPIVMTDGIVPATGEMPPLSEYLQVLADFTPATLIVDDAHGLGVLGASGRGTLEHLGLDDSANGGPDHGGVAIFCGGTLSKAMGGFGGIITGSGEFLHRVRSASHYYDGASAPPAPVATATAKALEILAADPSFRQSLQRNSQHLRQGLRGLGLDAHEVPSAQVGVRVGTAANMSRLHRELRDAGFIVPAITAYAGAGAEGLLRFAVCAGHTPQMIDELLGTLCLIL